MFSLKKNKKTLLLKHISEQLDKTQSSFETEFPELTAELHKHHTTLAALISKKTAHISIADIVERQSVEKEVVDSIKETQKKPTDLLTVSQEETEQILKKIQAYVLQTPGVIEKDDELYLAQQLSDILGFNISASLNEIHLPATIVRLGISRYRLPKSMDAHDVSSSQIRHTRGYFGWPSPRLQTHINHQYGLSLPLLGLEQNKYINHLSWFYQKKVLLVNPLRNKVCIVSIIDVTASNTTQTQALVTPNVIRETELWSGNSKGQALMFFIDDTDQKLVEGSSELFPNISIEYELDTIFNTKL